ncbi:hypothetical protein L1987_14955 [Smallanthus sonchifolius]|uniref:Uncharacterized protein n=1 Tax=Smallanthus sonchifolius TaxID=185202 RepID=A0ACB9J5S7_9ASTR|nr:hypothetical protein L1987_14955 [Smallanthus sonchifolius]
MGVVVTTLALVARTGDGGGSSDDIPFYGGVVRVEESVLWVADSVLIGVGGDGDDFFGVIDERSDKAGDVFYHNCHKLLKGRRLTLGDMMGGE